jgi:hypothetical protein
VTTIQLIEGTHKAAQLANLFVGWWMNFITLPGPKSNSSAIARIDLPSERAFSLRWAKLKSSVSLGLPPTIPLARARSRPAMMRSLSRTRSCLATAARMSITASLNCLCCQDIVP